MKSWRPICPLSGALNPVLRVTCKDSLRRWDVLAPQFPGSERDLGSEGWVERSLLTWKLPGHQILLEGGSRNYYVENLFENP